MAADTRARVRLAELVGALSLGIDLGFGQPMEHVLRQCSIALRLAERIGLPDEQRVVVYYTALLVNVGCHTDAHEQARWFGDDIAMKAQKYDHELRSVRGMAAGLRLIGSGRSPLHRFRTGLEFALGGFRDMDGMIEHHAAISRRLADTLGLPPEVGRALDASYEQWDGRGWPGEFRGDAIPQASRIAQIAEFVDVAHRVGGPSAAATMARERSGTQFDPELAGLVVNASDALFEGLEETGNWHAVIEAEPSLGVDLDDQEADEALLAIANFVDLKSPFMLGHAQAVAELAARAAIGLGVSDVRTIRRAGLVHDLGRLGISNAIWDKPGPLGPGERERVRLHPYLTSRMLQQSTALQPLGAIVLLHRERLDGSGYPAGLSGAAIPGPARILGAADAYQAMREPRPHRPALTAERAAEELRAEAAAGRFDAEVVEAVLSVAGHRAVRRREGPAGLTEREVDVLRLVARGLSNKEIARELVISPKTVGTHIEHIYGKLGFSSRARASLFAMEHGLLPEEQFSTPLAA